MQIITKFRAVFVTGIILVLVFTAQGCSRLPQIQSDSLVKENQEIPREIREIAESYRDIYETAAAADTLGTLAVTRSIVDRLGEQGYIAVDIGNQINMTCADKAEQFLKHAADGGKDTITILSVLDNGGFLKYDIETDGKAETITQGCYLLEDGNLINTDLHSFQPQTWEYTDDGYLLFEEYRMPGYDGPSGHTALRIQPLNETCRELNQIYILPVGYCLNDLFLSDWTEGNFGEIDFYDLFDLFYPQIMNTASPYTADDNCGVGKIYQIPEKEFEHVIQSRFHISSTVLQEKTTYFPEDKAYEYRPRGIYDCEQTRYLYPEVVDYTSNADGTITLTVHAVYPDRNTSSAFTHEVTIRPLPDHQFEYVSNRVAAPEDFHDTWHKDRLTKEQWNQVYGEVSQ